MSWIDLMLIAVVIMLVWRELQKERFERERDAKTLARKLEGEDEEWL